MEATALTVLVGAASALVGGGGVLGYFKLRSDNRLTDATAWQLLVKSQAERIDHLETQVKDLETRLTECERRWMEVQND